MNKYINKMASLHRYATLLSNIHHNLFICILVSLVMPTSERASAKVYGSQQRFDGERRLTKEYQLRQGSLRGLIVQPGKQNQLQSVEMFLGIPYAAPPVGSQRFMPPGSALPWSGVKMATDFAPVCPQMLPPENKNNPLSPGRQQYMRRLTPFLEIESEDCLYLNIYVPKQEHRAKKLPVLVFIHGDSFEWSSGNPYDGRILASYGNLMVVTINFRLGIFGFMKPSLTDHAYGNNGLLDQLAALKWVQDNIADLHGDPDSVTLMGHGTGAACVNFLMISPIIPDGLFHRAILMSGSALSDWALTKDPTQYTIQVAQHLNCHISNNTMSCLQNKRLSDIKKVQILARKFATPLGPMVSGSFIPMEPSRMMQSYPNIFSKYELLSGVTELESYHQFRVIELGQGVIEKERDELVEQYAQVLYDNAPDVAARDIKQVYFRGLNSNQDWGANANRENRDFLLDALSDAQTLSPLVMTANYHSKANAKSYFYVFGHNSEHTDYAALRKSVQGEELPYVFGVPLGGANTHFHEEYTAKERLLSEVVMRKWSNFIKLGTPNTQKIDNYLTLTSKDWNLYNIDWPEYNYQHQSFLHIDVPPSHFVRSFYRANYSKFWNEVLPNKMKNYAVSPLFEYEPVATTARPRKTLPSPGFIDRINWKPPQTVINQRQPEYSSTVYGRPRQFIPPTSKISPDDVYKEIKAIKVPSRQIPPSLDIFKHDQTKKDVVNNPTEKPVQNSSTTVTILIATGCIFLIVNILIFATLYYKKRRLHARERQLKIENASDNNLESNNLNLKSREITPFLKFKNSVTNTMNWGRKNRSNRIKKISKLSSIKTPKSDDSGGFRQRFKLRRHLSSSTIDANTKVRDWITNEIMNRCSPQLERKSNLIDEIDSPKILNKQKSYKSDDVINKIKKKSNTSKESLYNTSHNNDTFPISKSLNKKSITIDKNTSRSTDLSNASKKNSHDELDVEKKISSSKSTDSIATSEGNRSNKVSVAVDATPAARKNEILLQRPIELSKSIDNVDTRKKNINETTKPVLRRSKTETDVEETHSGTNTENIKKTSFKNTLNFSLVDDDKLRSHKSTKLINISHKHSVSDPVQDANYDYGHSSDLSTILPPSTFRNNINVTSKDEPDQVLPLTSAETLLTIQRRNYPKVLPDLPRSYNNHKRLSLQQNSMQSFKSFINNETNNVGGSLSGKTPPLPPPRTTSTLDRRIGFKNSKSSTTSSFDSGKISLNSFGDKESMQINDNYSNIDVLATLLREMNKNCDENKIIDRYDYLTTSSQSGRRELPKVIIAANNIPNINDSKIIINPIIEKSQAVIRTNVPRVRLPENFHTVSSESDVTGSSLSMTSDIVDNLDEYDDEDDLSNAELIEALVGSTETSLSSMDIPDTKGPDDSIINKLEIIPVKVNVAQQIKNTESFKFCSDKILPDVTDFERTAQIKPKSSLNKLKNRSESINKPPEREIIMRDKKTSPFLTKNNNKNSTSRRSSRSIKNKTETKIQIPLQHSNSGSSNDTESSTGTVKLADLKK